jgi:hypothetical protein
MIFVAPKVDGVTGSGQVNIGGNAICAPFYYSGGEVRPRNMAIKVWKRTN